MAFSWNILAFRKSPKDLVTAVKRSLGTSAGVHVYEDTAMKVAAYHRGLVYISTQIAKLPWDVKDKDFNIIEDSVYRLLNTTPNDEMNAFSFRLYMIQTAINHGNSFAEIERDATGRPVALWPIQHDRVDLVRNSSGQLLYRIVGGAVSGENVYLKPIDMFHVKNFHTKDGLVGQGLIAYGTDVLGITIGADRMAGNLFANGGIPSGVLEVKGGLSDEVFARIKKSWDESHTGRKSAGVAVLEEGITFKATTVTPDMLQFLESRKFSVIELARFFGVPPTKFFDNTASTFNNIENSNLEVATDTLDAWACNLEKEADWKLLNKGYGGKFTEFDFFALNRGDMKTRSDYFSKMMQTGSITPNQIRRLEGRAPYKGGDRYYIAVNNYSPADRIDEIIDAQTDPKSPPALKAPEKEEATDNALEKAAIDYLKR